MRDGNNIQLIVKNENQGNVYEVKKPNASLQENFDMFVNSDFGIIRRKLYFTAQKLINAKQSQAEGIILPQSDSDRMSIF